MDSLRRACASFDASIGASTFGRIFRLEGRGTLKAGAWGDVTVLDPDLRWTFDASRSKSKSRNTPFDNWTLHGAAVATIVAGRVVHRRERSAVASS